MVKNSLIAFCFLFPLFLTVLMFSKQNSENARPDRSSDYSFRVAGSLDPNPRDETDEDAVRVEKEKSLNDKKDLTRLPAAAEFCRLSQELTLHNDTKFEIQNLNQRLRARGLELGKDAAEIFSETGPLFSASPSAPSTPVGKFLFALRKAGMVDGVDWEQPDYEAAANLMNELRQNDPDNAAPVLFQLMIESRRGTPIEDLSDLVREILNARKFDTFYTAAMKELRDSSIAWQDATSYMLAQHVLSLMPVPGYQAMPSLINQLAETAPELKEHLADLMTQPGQAATESFASYGYSVLDYSYGRSLTDRSLPRFTEMEQFKYQPTVPAEEMTIDTQNCSDNTYRDFVAKLSSLKSDLFRK